MAIYKVLSPLNHNNKSYHPGDEVELDEKNADVLLKADVVSAVDKPKACKETTKESTSKTVKDDK